jgi:hypothetical protein
MLLAQQRCHADALVALAGSCVPGNTMSKSSKS